MLQFEGQTKGKLGTSEARSSIDAIVSEHLAYFLEENPDVATLVRKALKQRQAREATRKAREEARSGKKKKNQKVR